MVKRSILALPLMLILAAGLLSLGGCFQTPTDPFGGHHQGGLTPTPTPGPGGGGGSISGTVSGFGSETVTITAGNTSGEFSTTRNGDGPYTISGVPDGNYSVMADSASFFGMYSGGGIHISGGTAVTGINITAY
jgi:hypothetical protein